MPNSTQPNKCAKCNVQTEVDEIKLGATSYFAVVCPVCHVRGPAAFNVADAIIKWDELKKV